MKTRIIRMAIGLTALVVSFLPQNAQAAVCSSGPCTKIISLPGGGQLTIVTSCTIVAPVCSAGCINDIAVCSA